LRLEARNLRYLLHHDFSTNIAKAHIVSFILVVKQPHIRGILIQLTKFINETSTKIVLIYIDATNTVRTKKIRKLLGQTCIII